MSTSGARARLSKVVVDRGVSIPEGLVVGEDPDRDAQRFRRTERGVCLITQHMIDRLAIHEPLVGDRLKVLSVASEIFPLVKTGGLADVVGALPAALAGEGVAVRTLVPGYPAVLEELGGTRRSLRVRRIFLAGPRSFSPRRRRARSARARRAASLRPRRATPTRTSGRDWPDNAQRFAALAWSPPRSGGPRPGAIVPTSSTRMTGRRASFRPICIMTGERGRRPSMTVHNFAFQGHFPAELLARSSSLRRPSRSTASSIFGGIGFLKAGLQFADRDHHRLADLRGRNPHAGRRHGARRPAARCAPACRGILNGIDEAVWNPATDPDLAATFDAAHSLAGGGTRRRCRQRFGLRRRMPCCFGVVSRLSEQKGLDLLLAALPRLLALGADLVVLGSGDAELESGFAWPPRAIRAASACSSAMTRRSRT